MRFRELVLHNVGVYVGRQSIDLRSSTERPVVLVGGLNGCGKTTFLDSLQLVLYGRRARLSNRGNKSWDAFLLETISRGVDPSDGAAIELTFEVDIEGATRVYDISRTWRASGQSVREIVTVFVDGKSSPNLSTGWADHVEELLPLDIASLFFFDGEKIESLADPDTASNVIRSAVHSLLGIGTLEQLSTDLVALQRRQKPAAHDATSDLKVRGATERLHRLETELDLITQRYAACNSRHGEAAKNLEKTERAFERDGGRLYEQRANLEAERRGVVSHLEAVQSQLRGLAEGSLPLRLLERQLISLRQDAAADEATLAARRLRDVLVTRDERLLAELSDTSREEVAPRLKSLRENLVIEADRPLVADLPADAVQQLEVLQADLASTVHSSHELLQRSEELSAQLDELDASLAGVPSTELIHSRLEERDAARLALARVTGEQDSLGEELDRLKAAKAEAVRALDLAEADRRACAAHDDEVRRVLTHTDRVRATLTELKGRLIERNLGKLEVATLDSFRALMRKHRLVEDLRIDANDFSVHLIGRTGHELPASRLSAGERQLLAVALLWGLAKVAGHRLPTVVDTPLGRLDSKHRERLVERYFPNAGSQVLLLSTDEEIDEPLLRMLEPSLASTFLLSHDDSNHSTRIDSGYWWPVKESHVA